MVHIMRGRTSTARVACLLIGAALLASGALSVTASSAHAYAIYGCFAKKCPGAEGPTENGINHVRGENIQATGVCASVFESGGPRRGYECDPNGKGVYAGNDCFSFRGYTTVARYYQLYEYYFGGEQYLQEPVCTIAEVSSDSSSAASGVARPATVPADAVLALNRGERRVWTWESSTEQSSSPASNAATAFENQFAASPAAAARAASFAAHRAGSSEEPEMCMAHESPGVNGVPVEGQSCAPASTVAREGNVGFSGAGGPSFPVTITVMVPNGVASVEITEADGSMRSVKVENNVALAVVPGGENALPRQPATAVSYQMPDGSVQNIMAPAQ